MILLPIQELRLYYLWDCEGDLTTVPPHHKKRKPTLTGWIKYWREAASKYYIRTKDGKHYYTLQS